MTSNVGARHITNMNSGELGFAFSDEKAENQKDFEQIKKAVMGELKETFRPEFLNRIDEIIVFKKLTEIEISEIAKLMLTSLDKRLADLNIKIKFSDEAIKQIAKVGFDPVYGARPLKRAITTNIEDCISEEIIQGKLKSGDTAECVVENEKFVFNKI